MDLTALIAFVGVATTMIVLPGPDWAVVVSAGLRNGVVAPTVGGLALGYVVITSVVVVGIAALVASAPAAVVAISLVGALYLFWLGIGVLRHPATTSPHEGAAVPTSTASLVRQGMGVSALNPKAVLFFLAFLPQFARRDAPWPFPLQLGVLGATWALLAAVIYGLLGVTIRQVLTTRPRFARGTTVFSGVAMLVAAALLILEQVVGLASG